MARVKKVSTIVLDIGGEDLMLVPITKREISISHMTSNVSSAVPTTTKINTLDVAGSNDKVIGYLIAPVDAEEVG